MPRRDGTDTPKEARFRQFVRELLDQGIKPTPMEVHRRQGDNKFVNLPTYPYRGPMFSGSLSIIRSEEFERAGWRSEYVGKSLRWMPPSA